MLEDFDVFPSSEAWLADAREAGFAGCISATVNLTASTAQQAWVGSGSAAGLAAARKASDLRDLFTAHPLVSAIKGALAMRYQDLHWARLALPALSLSAESRDCLWETFTAKLAAD